MISMNKAIMRETIFCLIAAGVFFLGIIYGRQSYFTLSVLNQALSATGAQVSEVDINGWVRGDSVPVDESFLEQNVRKAFTELGYDGNQVAIEKKQNNYFSQFRGEIRTDKSQLVVISQKIYPRSAQPAECYTVINAGISVQNASGEEWERKITKTLAEFGPRPQINTCLVGWLDGKLNKNNLEHRLLLAFDSIQAIVQEPVFVDDFASFTGYTPSLARFLTVNHNKVNVNMAMRYHPVEEKTYVTVGSPVITREY